MTKPSDQTKVKTADSTRTARSNAYLDRLQEARGKRLLVDLDKPAKQALEVLLESGYGTSQAAVVRRALVSAAEKLS